MFSLKYLSNLFFSSLYFSWSVKGSFASEIFGHISEYFLLTSNHFSYLSVSDIIASMGYSGSQTPQSISHQV